MRPVEGEVRWRGVPVEKAAQDFWRELCYIGHRNGVGDDLSVLENVMINANVAAVPVTENAALDALDAVGLADFVDVPAGQLSGPAPPRRARPPLAFPLRDALGSRQALHRARRARRRPPCGPRGRACQVGRHRDARHPSGKCPSTASNTSSSSPNAGPRAAARRSRLRSTTKALLKRTTQGKERRSHVQAFPESSSAAT